VQVDTSVANIRVVQVGTIEAINVGVPVNTNVAINGRVPVDTIVANNVRVPVSTILANNVGLPFSTSVEKNIGVPVSTTLANNVGVPVSTNSNAHSTHLHLSHPPTHMYRTPTAAEHKHNSHVLQLCPCWLASTVANILPRKHNELHLCGSDVSIANS
jgi:hypothetical protein